MKMPTVVAAFVAALLVLGGCAADEPIEINGLSWARYSPSGEGGDMARVAGTVVDVDGCAGIDTDTPGEDGMVLLFANTDKRPRDLEVGDYFEASGGEVRWDDVPASDSAEDSVDEPEFAETWFTLPASCADATHFWIVNRD